LYSDGLKNDKAKGKEIQTRAIGNDSVKEIMESSQLEITNIQETQTIQKSWKMNVSSIVAVDNINSTLSCNYDQSSSHIHISCDYDDVND
jgi:hypothetical protein